MCSYTSQCVLSNQSSMSKLQVRSFNPVWGNCKGNTHYQTMSFSSMLCAMTGQLCVRPPEGIMVKLKWGCLLSLPAGTWGTRSSTAKIESINRSHRFTNWQKPPPSINCLHEAVLHRSDVVKNLSVSLDGGPIQIYSLAASTAGCSE